MNAASFNKWERLREQREGGALSRWLVALISGGVLAALVEWRSRTGVVAASHLWLAGACAAFVVAFMRVPVQIYWRKDAAMLAQLPIEGGVLFDAAIRRCIRAAIATLVVPMLGAIPIALLSPEVVNQATRTLQAVPIAGDPVPRLVPLELFARHAGFAVAFALIAACFIPAVTMWAATLVASSKDLLQIATKLGGAPVRADNKPMHVPMLASGGQVLGAIPGFASSVAFVILFILSPWLVNRDTAIDANIGLVAIAIGSIAPLVLLRARIAPQMGDILRDVSALDRQRLAFIEVHPLTAIERLVAKLSGAALAYSKDARLMRRRYPMAFALGALAFIVLAIIGLAQPDDATWLVATLAGAGLYAIALARRLGQPPIELARLSTTLPISHAEIRRAKIAWVAAWVITFIAVPATFALVR